MKLKLARTKITFEYELDGKEEKFEYVQQTTKQGIFLQENFSFNNLIEIMKKNTIHKNPKKVDELYDDVVENFSILDMKEELDREVGNAKQRE
jgi:hypothetical protein